MATPLLYALHSGKLYGTERMALATAKALGRTFDPVIFAPPGEALDEARRMGFGAEAFTSASSFAVALRRHLRGQSRVAFIATGVSQSAIFAALTVLGPRHKAHLHVVHGGADERLAYGRKKLVAPLGVRFVAVSAFVRERLVAHGVPESRIHVVENFLEPERMARFPRRQSFAKDGVRRVVVVSRVDPIKRIDLVLDALDQEPALEVLEIRVLGSGWQIEELRERARRTHPNVALVGFTDHVPEELAASDLLLHTCPEEPFGLAILEAMAVGLPVLVPDAGGAGSLVEPERSGFRFRANDAGSLAGALSRLSKAPAEMLASVVEGARVALASRFAPAARAQDYRLLIEEALR